MSLFYESIELIASFIEFFVLYKIYSALFNEYCRRRSRSLDIVLAIGGTVITYICNNIALFSYFTLLVFTLYTSISAIFLYRINYVALFSVASFYVLCLSCFDFLVFTLVSNFYGGYETFVKLVSAMGSFRAIIISAIKILWIIAYFLLKKYLYRFAGKKNYIYMVLIISCAGFLGFMYLAEQTFKAFDYTMPGLWFVFFAFFALFLFAVYFVMESREEKMKLNFAEMRNTLLEENYNTINDIYMSNAKLYHDLNNHLNVLYQLLDEGNGDGAKEYIKEISRPIMKLSKTIWTGIDVVDVIINSKIEKMREMNISYEINVEFPQNTNILPHDMCTILANLLDNAIEAVGAMEELGTVELTIRRINHFLLIKVSNSCATQKEKFVNYPSTTKENKELHGWGLPSVKDAVDKYNGTLKCTNENNLFNVTIMIFFEKKDSL